MAHLSDRFPDDATTFPRFFTHYMRFRTSSNAGHYRPTSLAFYAGHMDRSDELLRLQKELAAATSEFTAAMNEQFLAVISDEPDSDFVAKVAEAGKKRKLAMDALLNHIKEHGW